MEYLKYIYWLLCVVLVGCTITFDQVMTQGKAEDVIDNTPTTQVTTKTTIPLDIPL